MKCLIVGQPNVGRFLARALIMRNIEVNLDDGNISNMIENTDIIIADISHNNPNVLYEIGYAHALKKAVIPIVERSNVKIPSQLQGVLYFAYDINDLGILADQIIAWIRMYVEPYKLGETKI